MTKAQDTDRRLEDLELQVDSLMEQGARTERLMQHINGGLTTLKWAGAGAAGLLAILELIWSITD